MKETEQVLKENGVVVPPPAQVCIRVIITNFLTFIKVLFLSSVIMCESLSAPLNGTISFQADATAIFDFKTTATYACDKGFALSGGNPERTCEEGPTEGMGAWSGSAPTCSGKLIFCCFNVHASRFYYLNACPLPQKYCVIHQAIRLTAK